MSTIPDHTIGEAEITRVTEQVAELPSSQLFPDHREEPPAAGLTTPVPVSIHSWIVRLPDRLIVIDTGVGNNKDRDGNPLFHNLKTDYADRLAAAGVAREDVDTVLLTHLHTDHIGWNTYWDGECWQPMFPNARYVFSSKELEQWQRDPARSTMLGDSIQPIVDAGLVQTIDPSALREIGDGLVYHSSPGHSPDHASIALTSRGEHALFGGDVLHHPVQTRYPQWNSTFCEDKPRAVESRLWALDWCATHEALYFSSHFADGSAGHILRSTTGSDGYDWAFQ